VRESTRQPPWSVEAAPPSRHTHGQVYHHTTTPPPGSKYTPTWPIEGAPSTDIIDSAPDSNVQRLGGITAVVARQLLWCEAHVPYCCCCCCCAVGCHAGTLPGGCKQQGGRQAGVNFVQGGVPAEMQGSCTVFRTTTNQAAVGMTPRLGM
jgi:hypothetical protein